jgi:hypothetical protein
MTNKEQLERVARAILDEEERLVEFDSLTDGEQAIMKAQAAIDAMDAQQERLGSALEVARDALEEGIFNAESVIINMKEVQGGAGFSVSDEKDWIPKAQKALTTINEILEKK